MVLLIASIASFMATFDSNVVNLALPSIAKAFDATFSDIILITTAYLVVIASLQTTFGRLGDRRGMKEVFILGLVVFTSGSFLAGLSGGVGQMIAFRIVQGVGSAVMSAISGALVAREFPLAERGRILGITLSAAYAGLTAGPAVGGVLVQLLGWRSIFYVNVPIGVATVLLSFVYLRSEKIPRTSALFDFPGAITLTSFLVTLLLALSGLEINRWELTSLVLACFASFVSFVFLERREGIAPLIDLRLFTQNRVFAAGNVTALMNYTTASGAVLVLSLYLQDVLGYSPVAAGLILLAQPAIMVLTAPVAGSLSDRISPGILSAIGMLAKVIAFVSLSFLGVSSSSESIWLPLMLIGFGHALFSSPNSNSVMSSVPREQIGLASGTLGTVRAIGQSVGVTVLGGVVAASMPSGAFAALSGGSVASGATTQLFITGMHAAFLLAALLCAIGVFSSLVRAKRNGSGGEPGPAASTDGTGLPTELEKAGG
ncbi:MAG: MFS transporter [Thaumarchaeota archaeon]|nr:MFS transporter [Nitrososphaerota archaeon]